MQEITDGSKRAVTLEFLKRELVILGTKGHFPFPMGSNCQSSQLHLETFVSLCDVNRSCTDLTTGPLDVCDGGTMKHTHTDLQCAHKQAVI